jgi:putative aldouronate transport system substrate-binding protein
MKKSVRIMAMLSALLLAAGCASSAPLVSSSPSTAASSATAPVAEADTTSSEPATASELENVTLEWLFMGVRPDDFDFMHEELNKKLSTDLNCTINASWLGWGEYGTKYPLILASGEVVDLTYGASWMNFAKEASKGAYYPLEEIAPTASPLAFSRLPKEGIASLSVDGHLYALTGDLLELQIMGYLVRGDLMDQYGMTDIASFDDLEKYFQEVVDNNPELEPAGFGPTGHMIQYVPQNLGYYQLATYNFPLVVDMSDQAAGKIVNFYEDPYMPEFFAMMKDWCDRGFWGKDVLSRQSTKSKLITGEAAVDMHNQKDWITYSMEAPAEFDLRYFPGQPNAYRDAYTQNVVCCGAAAKNPERSLMVYEKFVTDESYYNMIHYGVEGRNFEITQEGFVNPLDSSLFTPDVMSFAWATKTPDFTKDVVGVPASKPEVWEKVESIAADNRYKMFTFNSEPVKNEFAAISNILTEYSLPLGLGYLEDPEAGLQTLLDQLNAAGLDKVREEMQKQVDAFNAEWDN